MHIDPSAPEERQAQSPPPDSEERSDPEPVDQRDVIQKRPARRHRRGLGIAVKVATIVATLFTVSVGTSALLLNASPQRLLLVAVCFESLLLFVLFGTWVLKEPA